MKPSPIHPLFYHIINCDFENVKAAMDAMPIDEFCLTQDPSFFQVLFTFSRRKEPFFSQVSKYVKNRHSAPLLNAFTCELSLCLEREASIREFLGDVQRTDFDDAIGKKLNDVNERLKILTDAKRMN